MNRATINEKIQIIIGDVEDTTTLTQSELNQITDEIAGYVDSINPDREYPKVIVH